MTQSVPRSGSVPGCGPVPCFDRVARLYRPMEYASFGSLLERCRFYHLPALLSRRRALVIGDGDGRFLARLLAANPQLRADTVDASPAMLRLLFGRAASIGAQNRLTTLCADARASLPSADGYDLVVTHFFLDCLTSAEAEQLIARVRSRLAPEAVWLVSEFQVPAAGQLRTQVGKWLIASLYAAFHLLTGLRVRQIPPWRDLLATAGWTNTASRISLGGLLTSELWQYCGTTALCPRHSQKEVATDSHFAAAPGTVPGIDPGPEPIPGLPPQPEPDPAPGPAPEPDPEPYPGPIPAPQPVTRIACDAACGSMFA